MKKLRLLFLPIVLATVAFAGSTFPNIAHEELQEAIASGKAVIFDVNGTSSYKNGHIPGAIDYAANKARIASLLPADKNALIVAYCGSERCGAYARAATAAKDLGYTNVKHYSPGLAGWKKSGAKVEKPST